jgi:hypothetical protein
MRFRSAQKGACRKDDKTGKGERNASPLPGRLTLFDRLGSRNSQPAVKDSFFSPVDPQTHLDDPQGARGAHHLAEVRLVP